ncbi:uncharacterized protein FIBRA_00892 [Fibroporia radiculosa]|uniref:C2H2-type domain-containing protein n=1 Tax=Fibroporia radiculosa TaxID=599839 RepID=J4GIW2_9APHY|nr:uncharacterized protein FIBRA_00892 [Fibroporia radiculosa]CCL98885.1 predicted protein [Fibroporia radiculosa]
MHPQRISPETYLSLRPSFPPRYDEGWQPRTPGYFMPPYAPLAAHSSYVGTAAVEMRERKAVSKPLNDCLQFSNPDMSLNPNSHRHGRFCDISLGNETTFSTSSPRALRPEFSMLPRAHIASGSALTGRLYDSMPSAGFSGRTSDNEAYPAPWRNRGSAASLGDNVGTEPDFAILQRGVTELPLPRTSDATARFGQFPANWEPVLPRTTSVPPAESMCLWQGCHMQLTDTTVAGVQHHLNQYHAVPKVVRNSKHHRSQCLWIDGAVCNAELDTAGLAKHVAAKHLKSLRKKCSQCQVVVGRPDSLRRHIKDHCRMRLQPGAGRVPTV